MLRLSASRLKLLDSCPRAYFERHVAGKPEPSGDAAALGSAVHDTIEKRMNTGMGVDEALAEFRAAWTNRGGNPLAKQVEEGEEMIRTHFEMFPSLPAGTLQTEREITLSVLEEDDLLGYIDLVHFEDDAVTLHDWKTGMMLPTREEAESDIQAGIYALWASKVWPDKEIVTSWHYLRQGARIDVHWPQYKLDNLDDWLYATANRLADEQVQGPELFPPKPSGRCAWCAFSKDCPVFATEATEADPLDAADCIDQMEHAKAMAKAWDARAKKLGETMKHLLDAGPIEHDGRVWSMGKTTRRSLDPIYIGRLEAEFGLELGQALDVKVSVLEARLKALPKTEQKRAKEMIRGLVTETYIPRMMNRKI